MKPTEAEKEAARLKDPYMKALLNYTKGDMNQLRAIKKVGFIPITQEGTLDEFLLAVKDPMSKITPEAVEVALPQLEAYVECNTLPKKFKKTFTKARDSLRNLRVAKSINKFEPSEKPAIESYVAMAHTVSGESKVWNGKKGEFVDFDMTGIPPVASDKYVQP
jgi:hypothetical protein